MRLIAMMLVAMFSLVIGGSSVMAQAADSVDVLLQVGTPVTGPGQSSSGGGRASKNEDLVVELREVVVSSTKVDIEWSATESVKVSARWGATPEVGDGISKTINYRHSGIIVIEDLKPDTDYWFELVFETRQGSTESIEIPATTKQSIIVDQSRTPARNFEIIVNDDKVDLMWVNTIDSDKVRIVRSDKFLPRDYLDGEVIYEGSNPSFTHKLSDLNAGETFYYTLFQVKDGTYSYGTSQILTLKNDEDENNLVQESLLKNISVDNGQSTTNFDTNINQTLPTVLLDFCSSSANSVTDCSTSKIFEVSAGEQSVLVINSNFEEEVEIATLILESKDLVQADRIYLLERNNVGQWGLRLPTINTGDYDFSVQFYTRQGELVYRDSGVLRSLNESDLKPDSSMRDNVVSEPSLDANMFVIYGGIINILLILLVFYISRGKKF